MWAGNERVNNQNTPITTDFVTAMVKGGSNGFALKASDATVGTLKTMFDGPRPSGYQPMRKQGEWGGRRVTGCSRREDLVSPLTLPA